MKPTMQTGQAIVTVLFISVVGMMVASGAMFALIGTYQSVTNTQLAARAFAAAESGAENGLLQLLRTPEYTGETFDIGPNASADISVETLGNNIVITSVGKAGDVEKSVIVRAHYTGLELIVDSWDEEDL